MRHQKQADDGEYRLNVRFPAGVGWSLKKAADRNRRSINSEIVVHVERGLAAQKTASEPTA